MMSVGFKRTFLIALMALSAGCAEMQNFDLVQVLSMGMPLDQPTVARGLKQALDVGTKRTTASLSAPGGFAQNPGVRIRLPGELGTLAKALRNVGMGSSVDAFEDSMNLAAEQAAARAVPVFTSAILSMTIADAFEILHGADDAATTYFRKNTSAPLRAEFAPIVTSAMQEVGLYRSYQELVARYDAIPFAKPPALNLENFIVDETLEGLFAELAKEEGRIRQDPAARSTALLRRVFGSTDPPPES